MLPTLIILALVAVSFHVFASPALAVWTPLIASTDFDGIKADVLTASAGMLAVLLVIAGVGLLIHIMSSR